MRPIIVLVACAVPLASCNNSPQIDKDNASVAEVQKEIAKASASDNFVRAGLWESKVAIEDMQMPGMPAEMQGHMKEMIAQRQTEGFQSCLTEEEVKRPKEDFFAGDNKNCRYDHFKMGGGKIDAAMRCSSEGGSHVMTMTGDYTPDTYNMQMSMKASGGAGADAGMSMRMRVDAKRIGQCTGKEKA